ncbi:IS110 family transposase [Aeromicrobium sp. Sec7.5]|uniref:IS110 family transposase n=1 Tax=Aeromicrobium sp. Sec7.5 TaxID=3121276 RepID=UPI002FE432F6
MPAYVGIDWSESYQDWAAVDHEGTKIEGGRFLETPDGFDDFEARIRALADPETGTLPTIAIETEKGLTVANLRRRGYAVYAINPLKVSNYRTRKATSRGKSDKGDAMMIANIVRTDPDDHRALPNITPSGHAMTVLSRAHQDEIWRVTSIAAEMRSVLRTYYPTALEVYPTKTLVSDEARTVLRALPTPTAAAAKRAAGWKTLLRDSGRVKYIDRDAARRIESFRAPTLRVDPVEEAALGARLQALITTLDGAVTAQRTIEEQMMNAVRQHHYYPLLQPIVGIGDTIAARLLGEIGDDPYRFDNKNSIRSYAGTAPITRASGKSMVVNRRRVKNNRLNNAMYMWAFSAARFSPGAKMHYGVRREQGERHAAALRNLGNRLIGCLWHCMTTGEVWDEHRVWGHRYTLPPAMPLTVDLDSEEMRLETTLEGFDAAMEAAAETA